MMNPRVVFAATPTDPRHGTQNGYKNLGCRCDRCREANTLAHLAYMRSRRGSTDLDPERFRKNREPWIDGISDDSFAWFLGIVSAADMSRDEQWLHLQLKAATWPTATPTVREKAHGISSR